MAALQSWCQIWVVRPDGAEVATFVLEGHGAPDLGAVDAVARFALMARRLGVGIVLAEVSPTLRALLELTGLPVEVKGQSERREEPLRIQEGQEEVHPDDLPP